MHASDSESGSETDLDDTPTPLVAVPPKVLEPYLCIKRIQRVTSTSVPKWYRICGDNLDKTVKPRFMHSDKKNRSLHYFHALICSAEPS